MTERKALVVDDHPTNRLLAATLLKKLGWTTVDTDNGASAIELAAAGGFRLVLLDISMPGLSGMETCQQLRALPNCNPLQIIAYTAHAFPEERSEILAAGFDDILVKPIDRQRLEQLVADL